MISMEFKTPVYAFYRYLHLYGKFNYKITFYVKIHSLKASSNKKGRFCQMQQSHWISISKPVSICSAILCLFSKREILNWKIVITLWVIYFLRNWHM